MKSLTRRALVLALISCLAFVCAAAQDSTKAQPVKVVNTTKNPVPVVAQPDTTTYQFQSIVASQCENNGTVYFCTSSGPIDQTLTTLSSQGYELFSVVPTFLSEDQSAPMMLYTLRAPTTGAHSKRSSVPVKR